MSLANRAFVCALGFIIFIPPLLIGICAKVHFSLVLALWSDLWLHRKFLTKAVTFFKASLEKIVDLARNQMEANTT